MTQPDFWINTIQLACTGQSYSMTLCSPPRAEPKNIHYCSDDSLFAVIVYFHMAVVTVTAQRIPVIFYLANALLNRDFFDSVFCFSSFSAFSNSISGRFFSYLTANWHSALCPLISVSVVYNALINTIVCISAEFLLTFIQML